MARRKRKAKEQYTDYAWEIVAPAIAVPPAWLLRLDRLMKVSMTEEASDEFAPDFRGRESLWREIRQRLTSSSSGKPPTAGKIYEYAKRDNVWGDALKYIDVLAPDGEPVGWYDLDGGLVQYTTLWDLMFVDQPMIVDDRKLFMMTDEMWENNEYPPEVGGRVTSKEAREAKPAIVEKPTTTAVVISQHKSEAAAVKAAGKKPGSFIIHERETARTNERWLVAVTPGG
jgi:hypothetical protein